MLQDEGISKTRLTKRSVIGKCRTCKKPVRAGQHYKLAMLTMERQPHQAVLVWKFRHRWCLPTRTRTHLKTVMGYAYVAALSVLWLAIATWLI